MTKQAAARDVQRFARASGRLPARWRRLPAACACAVLLLPAHARAADALAPPAAPAAAEGQPQDHRQPLWELGLGIGALSIPNYPGSDQTQNYVLPLPYVIYRGEVFKADRDGVRAQFAQGHRFEFDISLGGTPPVLSEDSDSRRGMPNLPPTVEIGPELRVHLARDTDDENARRYEWNLHIPVRHSFTWSDGHLVQVGNVSYPHVNWKQKFRWLGQDWNLDTDLGAYINDRSYHQFFYDVPPRNATPTRPAFQAAGGYGGWEGTVFSSRRIDRFRVAGFLQFGSVGGAAFEESPLVRRSLVLSAGVLVNYVFWVSTQTVAGAADTGAAGGP